MCSQPSEEIVAFYICACKLFFYDMFIKIKQWFYISLFSIYDCRRHYIEFWNLCCSMRSSFNSSLMFT